MKLILASTSKLKNEILDKVRMKHESINSDFEESHQIKIMSINMLRIYHLAKQKA